MKETITINGMTKPLTVDLNDPILIEWSMTNHQGYRLQIFNEQQQAVYDVSNIAASENKMAVHLPQHPQRKKYQVKLTAGAGNDVTSYSSVFFTIAKREKPKETMGKWITRLDDPIKKERFYFSEEKNSCLSRSFTLEKCPSYAVIDCCGLGFYHLSVNGKTVSDVYLNSDVTNYDRVVYYDTYELTDFLQEGDNRIEVELANGWYNPAPIEILGRYNIRKQLAIGKPCFWGELQLNDGGENRYIYSDNQWQSSFGPYLQNNLYIGEIVTDVPDPRPEGKTVQIAGPAGRFKPSFIPKIKRTQSIVPQKMIETAAGLLIDFGQIISGQFACTLEEDFIGQIRISYAETLDEQGNPDYTSTISGTYGVYDPYEGKQPDDPIVQRDIIEKTAAKTFVFENRYTYHSFRYALIETKPADNLQSIVGAIKAYRLHTDVKSLVTLETSDPFLDQLWAVGQATRLNNIHSYFEDCTRERFGYGGDIVALLPTQMADLAIEPLLEKVLWDFVNDQRSDGAMTATAPFVGIMTNGPSNGGGALGWQLVVSELALALVKTYGKQAAVAKLRPQLERHLNYLLAFDFDYIAQCCLGDWGAIDETQQNGVITSPDQSFCSACMYLLLLQRYQELIDLRIIGKEDYCQRVTAAIQYTTLQIKQKFSKGNEQYGAGTLSSMIFAMKTGLSEKKRILPKLVQRIKQQEGIFSFGIFGMAWSYQLLAEAGYNDIIFDWLTRKSAPSYAAMLASGNGTLMEHFPTPQHSATYEGSLNHAMFASYGYWFVRHLLGIQVTSAGILIQPAFDVPIAHVKGSLQSTFGLVALSWEKTDRTVRLTVELPRTCGYEISQMKGFRIVSEKIEDEGGRKKVSCLYTITT